MVVGPAGRGDNPGIAERIVKGWLQPHQVWIGLDFPYVHEDAQLYQAWEVAAGRVWTYLSQGQDVAFVCEGDVSFYSTFNYLALLLRAQHPEIEIEVVPGVCSPLAVAALLGLPLTCQAERLAILPALYHIRDLEQTLAGAEVVVLLKVSRVYAQAWACLQQQQLLESSVVVEWAGHPQQRIYAPLTHHPQLELSYFSLLVVWKRPDLVPGILGLA